jgi:hypothetical protein
VSAPDLQLLSFDVFERWRFLRSKPTLGTTGAVHGPG